MPDVVPGGAVVGDQAAGAAVGQDGPRDVADAREVDDAVPAVDLGDRDRGAPRRSQAVVDVLEDLGRCRALSRWRKTRTAAAEAAGGERPVTQPVGHQDDGAFGPARSAQASPHTCSPG